jgi:predicted nuclease of restriction endonuclease-like (RecB) superfamily
MNLLQNTEYKHWLKDLKQKVLQSQLKAVVKVNSTLLEFYWELGEEIVLRQSQARWGDGFLKQLSHDLMAEFPEMKGFSKRNLEQIRKWYLFWSEASAIAQQPVSQLVQIPWGHNLKIITKCQSVEEAVYYVQNTQENGWSRSVLTHQIESGLWQREGKARRMGKGLHPCPSDHRIAIDGHVVPPLPILRGIVL